MKRAVSKAKAKAKAEVKVEKNHSSKHIFNDKLRTFEHATTTTTTANEWTKKMQRICEKEMLALGFQSAENTIK